MNILINSMLALLEQLSLALTMSVEPTETAGRRLTGLTALFLLSSLSWQTSYAVSVQASIDITGTVTGQWSATQDQQGNFSFSFLDFLTGPDLTISPNALPVLEIAALPSANQQYWSAFTTWDQGAVLLINNAVNYTNTVIGFLDLSPSSYAEIFTHFQTLQNSGPTEQTIGIPILKLFDSPAKQSDYGFSITPAVTFRYDVTIPTGASVLMDQPTVLIEGLTIESGGSLDVDAAITNFQVKHQVFNGGTLTITDGTWTHNNGLINQGVLNSFGGLVLGGSVSNIGILHAFSGSQLELSGTLDNQGEVVLDNSTAYLMGETTVGGAGKITLKNGGLSTDRYGQSIYGYSGRLTNMAGHTITGSGYVMGFITNEGLIEASDAGNPLWVNGYRNDTYSNTQTFNRGVLQANGGTLQVYGNWDNTGGTIQALNGSTLELNATIAGGLVKVSNNGHLVLNGGTNFSGGLLTIDGTAEVEGQGARLENITLGAGSQMNVVPGGWFELSGTLDNQGEVVLDNSTAYLMGETTVGGAGKITLKNGGLSTDRYGQSIYGYSGRLTNMAGHTITGSGYVMGFITNEGLIEASDAGNPLWVNGYRNDTYSNTQTFNRGVLQANGGTLQVYGNWDNTGGTIQALPGGQVIVSADTLTNNTGGTLTGGTYRVIAGASTATLDLGGQDITTNAAQVTLSGAGSSFAQINAITSNQGTFEVLGGRVFNTQSDFANAGAILVADVGSQLRVNGTYTQTDGITTLGSATLASSLIDLQGGLLNGNGSIEGSLHVGNGATVSPGFSPGQIAVTGDFALDTGGTLLLEAASPTQLDHLLIAGHGIFSGDIGIVFIGGFLPSAGDSFTFITTFSGADFSHIGSVNVFGLPTGYSYAINFGPNDLSFSTAAVPEPKTYLMMVLGLFLVGFVYRRRAMQMMN